MNNKIEFGPESMDSKCKVLIKMTPEKKVFSLIRNEKILESERLKIDTTCALATV